jgi:hypothetical protein
MVDRNEWNRRTIEEFRANGGKVGGMWEGRPLLVLTRGKERPAPHPCRDVPARW